MNGEAVRVSRILGAFWLLDGLLQLQPAMFGPAFVQQVLEPAASGQPEPVAWLIHWGIAGWQAGGVWSNWAAAGLQLLIGTLLGFSGIRGIRWGLRLSVIWGIGVWVFGEGLGGIFTPSASLLTGAPGSSLLYAGWSALLLWAPDTLETGALTLLRGFWFTGLVLNAVASRWLGALLRQMSGTPQPLWISAPIADAGAFLQRHSELGGLLTGAIWFALAVLWLIRPENGWTVFLTAWVLAFMWWIGMDFGVLGGTGTDPNTVPLVGLALWVWGRRSLKMRAFDCGIRRMIEYG